MAVRRMLQKRKKPKKVFSRRRGGGYAAAPTKSFWHFKDYARTDIEKAETGKVVKKYVKESFSKEDAKVILANDDWNFTMAYHIASTIAWAKLDYDIPKEWKHKPLFKKYFDGLKETGKEKLAQKVEEEKKPILRKKSPQEIIKAKTHDFISELEGVVDKYYTGENKEPAGLYEMLVAIDAPYNMAKAVYDKYVPLRDEARIASEGSDEQVKEAYASSWRSKIAINRFKRWIENLVDEAERYMFSKKAVRAVRKPKKLTADKQVKGVKYMETSSEFQLTSIPPTRIVGSKRLYLFNTKYRILVELISSSDKGFEVKGSAVQQVDFEKSREIKLRKPDEFLKVVMKNNPARIDKLWKGLSTKDGKPNGRINKNMIIMKALDA